MTFKIDKASDWNYKDLKEFTTIEELKDYIATKNPERESCVIYFDESRITIYDFWIE